MDQASQPIFISIKDLSSPTAHDSLKGKGPYGRSQNEYNAVTGNKRRHVGTEVSTVRTDRDNRTVQPAVMHAQQHHSDPTNPPSSIDSRWFMRNLLKLKIPEQGDGRARKGLRPDKKAIARNQDAKPTTPDDHMQDLYARRQQRKAALEKSRAASSIYTHVTPYPRIPSPLAPEPPVPALAFAPREKSRVSRWIEASTTSNPFSPITPHSAWHDGDSSEVSPLVELDEVEDEPKSSKTSRQSEGWWNMSILTPLLERSSTVFSRRSSRSRKSGLARPRQRPEIIPPVPALMLPLGNDATLLSPGPKTGKSSKWTDQSEWDEEHESLSLGARTTSPILQPGQFESSNKQAETWSRETNSASIESSPRLLDLASLEEKHASDGVTDCPRIQPDGDPDASTRRGRVEKVTAVVREAAPSSTFESLRGDDKQGTMSCGPFYSPQVEQKPIPHVTHDITHDTDGFTVRSTLPPPYSPRKTRRAQGDPARRIGATQFRQVDGLHHEVPRCEDAPNTQARLADRRLAVVKEALGSRDRYSVPRRVERSRITHLHFQSQNNFEETPVASSRTKAEKRRHDIEKQDATVRKIGSMWRGWGCFSRRGCFGDGRQEDQRRRSKRCCLGLVGGLIIIIVLVVVLYTMLGRKSSNPAGSAEPVANATSTTTLFTVTGYPPIPTGAASIVQPEKVSAITACVHPDTMWSCALPKEQQQNNVGAVDTPVIRFSISYVNTSQSENVRQPSPAVPSAEERRFLGNYTDYIQSAIKEGEDTPFLMDLVATNPVKAPASGTRLRQRDFPNLTDGIPPASTSADGTAAVANLLPDPLLTAQPIKLYDRDLPTEHYGFYAYYDRSIFLKSVALLNSSDINAGSVPADQNGGSTATEAKYRCTWSQTRFLIQIWTKVDSKSLLGSAAPGQSGSGPTNSTSQPGSFVYPTTVTLDRHGGDVTKKMIYCYGLDDRGQPVANQKTINLEDRGFGGTPVGGVQGPFGQSQVTIAQGGLGGIDGGTGGCSCKWQNFAS